MAEYEDMNHQAIERKIDALSPMHLTLEW